jgi:hypothetical protein
MASRKVRVFRYLDDLDCFVVSEEYARLAEHLGLVEWSSVVWIGRLFTLDNDYGEHWFDNWHLREEREADAARLGLASDELLIIDPQHFEDGRDGPCHPPEFRKRFWTDVLHSLELSYALLFDEARLANAERLRYDPDGYLPDLEERIAGLLGSDQS